MPRGIFGDAIGAERRINRNGNAAREQNTRERGEKFGAGGQHDRDGLPGFEAAAAQFVRDSRRSLVKLAERDRARLFLFFVKEDVSAIRLSAAAQPDYFGERFRFADLFFEVGWSYIMGDRLRGDGCAGSCSACACSSSSIRTIRGRILAQDRVDQILHRVGFSHHLIRQTHSTSGAEPQHELDAFEAAKPQLALEMNPRAARAKLFQPAQSAELNEQLPDGSKRFRFDDGLAIELYFGSAHRNAQGEASPGVRISNTPDEPSVPPGYRWFKFRY